MARETRGKRLEFLLGQYRAWTLTRLDGPPLLLQSEQIVLRESPGGSFLALFHPDLSLRRRIQRWHSKKEGRVCVEFYERPGSDSTPIVITPRESEFIGVSRDLQNCRFRRQIRKNLENEFPEVRWRRIGAQGGKSSSLGESCLRFLGRQKDGGLLAALALDSDFHPKALYRLLATAAIWTRLLQRRLSGRRAPCLLLLLPKWALSTALRLLSLTDPREISWTLYGASGNPTTSLFRCPSSLPSNATPSSASRWPAARTWNTSASLELLYAGVPAFTIRRFPRADGGSSYRFLGLEVARSYSALESPLYFGPPDFRSELSEATLPELRLLLESAARIRRHDSCDKTHPYYRRQNERWLEEMLLSRIRALDPDLEERFVYSQVPAFAGGHRGMIDLLAVRGDGRLVVVEIKIERDPDMLFQALDYWERVYLHNRENEFERRGYFEGWPLSKEPPLLYLTAPALAFHASLPIQAASLRNDIPLYKIGLQGNWRESVKVAYRERLRAG